MFGMFLNSFFSFSISIFISQRFVRVDFLSPHVITHNNSRTRTAKHQKYLSIIFHCQTYKWKLAGESSRVELSERAVGLLALVCHHFSHKSIWFVGRVPTTSYDYRLFIIIIVHRTIPTHACRWTCEHAMGNVYDMDARFKSLQKSARTDSEIRIFMFNNGCETTSYHFINYCVSLISYYFFWSFCH